MDRAMTTTSARLNVPPEPAPEPLGSALARLEARWGSAAVRLGNGGRIDGSTAIAPVGEIHSRASSGPGPTSNAGSSGDALVTLGALALAPMPDLEPVLAPTPSPDHRSAPEPATEAVSTGFPALDALLGTGGLPRRAGATLRGDASSGKTTLALRSVAEAQAVGGIVAWLDGGRTFDPLEAAARGVDLRWLVVLRPAEVGEGLRLAGALVSGRAVDLLVLDLPPRLAIANEALLRRLAAHARRIGVQLLILEPVDLAAPLHGALAEAAGVRLELERIGWLRLGRDIVGQRTAVTVAKNHFGPPGRQVELEIRYLDEGERVAGVARLLDAASAHGVAGAPRALPESPELEANLGSGDRFLPDTQPVGIRSPGTSEKVVIWAIPRSDTASVSPFEGREPSQHPPHGYLTMDGASMAVAMRTDATRPLRPARRHNGGRTRATPARAGGRVRGPSTTRRWPARRPRATSRSPRPRS
jgi:recombination protein RecA